MPKTHARVLGGGNTYVKIGLSDTKKVEFLAQLQDTPGSTKGNPVDIQGIGDEHPVEIVTPYAMGSGTIVLTIWQTWGKDGWVSAFMSTNVDGSMSDEAGIWDAFKNGASEHRGWDGYPVDIVEVLKAQRMNAEFIQVQKFEKGSDGSIARVKHYHGCVITDVQGNENISNDSMESRVTITMKYTHFTTTQA